MKKLVFAIIFVSIVGVSYSQIGPKNKYEFGLQFKPIFTANFFGTGPIGQTIEGSSLTQTQQFGNGIGALIRRNYKTNLAFETGIQFMRRNFIVDVDAPIVSSDTFRIVGYEIPFNVLVFIQLNENIFMNVAGGLSLDMFPSDVSVENKLMFTYAGRYSIFNLGLNANVGFEYRTKNNGIFYLGSTFHRPFWNIYRSSVDYTGDLAPKRFLLDFRGTYLTLDFRYYFHSNPDKVKTVERKYPGKKP